MLLIADEEGARSSYHGAPVVTSAMRVCEEFVLHLLAASCCVTCILITRIYIITLHYIFNIAYAT